MTRSDSPLPSPSTPNLLPGTWLGDYLIERHIGSGGMATVWLARHLPLDRQVALKILREEFAADPRNVLRFTREAKSAARLDTPTIVRIYEVGLFPARFSFLPRLFPLFRKEMRRPLHYIAEEYVPGMNLAQYVFRKGPLSTKQALSVLRAVAQALESASQAGVVHRDIKPENILIGEKGKLKVADFGLAFYADDHQPADLSLTRVGVTLGTPLFMSPEQGEGKKTDVRSDLYSLGATAFWMLTARPPYDGGSPMSVIVRHVSAEISDPRRHRPDIPPQLAELVMRLMAKKPEDRFDSPTRLLSEITRLEESLSSQMPVRDSDTDFSEISLFADPGDEPAFTHIMDVLNATRMFQNTLTEMKWLEPGQKTKRRLIVVGAVLLICGSAAFVAGRFWAYHHTRNLHRNDVEIQHLDSVEEQWVFASQMNTSDAWRSILRFFPNDRYWTVKAKMRLAFALMTEGRTKEAQPIFDSFASGESGGLSGIAFGLAGQAWVLAAEGDTTKAALLLSQLRKDGKSFDPQTETVISRTGALIRTKP